MGHFPRQGAAGRIAVGHVPQGDVDRQTLPPIEQRLRVLLRARRRKQQSANSDPQRTEAAYESNRHAKGDIDPDETPIVYNDNPV